MNRNHISLWLLLAAALAAVVCLSAFSPVSLGGFTLKDSGIVAELTAPTADVAEPFTTELLAENTPTASTAAQAQIVTAPDTMPKTILFIGDSMLEGLSPRLAAYCAENGHKLYSVIWYSSTSEVWGRSDKLKYYIRTLKPDYIFISLGANELFVKDIISKRAGYVDKILSDVGSIPYVWIGPPNWKPDTGINKLIASKTRKGSFFLSDGMSFERSKDGAHPTRSSAALWMDSVARWMPRHAAHPIKLDKPKASSGKPVRVFIHQPSEH